MMNNPIEELTGTSPVNLYTVSSGATIVDGDIVAFGSGASTCVKAADSAGYSVIGVAGRVDGGTVEVLDGILHFANGSSTEAVARTDRGKTCYAIGDNKVGIVGGTNKIPVGIVLDVDDGGVWVDTRPAAKAAALPATVVASSATDSASAITVVNALRTALIKAGVVSEA